MLSEYLVAESDLPCKAPDGGTVAIAHCIAAGIIVCAA